MGTLAHRRHAISDRTWEIVKDRLPGRVGIGGDRARDNRLCLNAACWMLRTGAPWRDVPPEMETGKTPIAVFVGGEIRG